MLSEHNPIAELIHQVQNKWKDEVSPFPQLKLVRWVIKPEEARLFEGFLKLESTEHGSISEVLVAMLTPFKNEKMHSSDLVNDWVQAFKEDHKTLEKLKAKGIKNIWNDEHFLKVSPANDEDSYGRLLNMVSSFHSTMLQKDMRLVIALFPYSIYDMDGYRRWLTRLLQQQIPNEISFMIFDHVGENYFDNIFREYPEITKSLHINLDMDGAVSKIAKMGDPHSPEVKLRECMLGMGKAVKNKDLENLHHWGDKALHVTQKSDSKSIYASAHIIYAGMLFNFKKFDKIDALLEQGLSITKKGLKFDEGACKPLIIQYYGYIAASRQLQKKIKESILSYEKQGDMAAEFLLPGIALTAYRQAYTLSKKKLPERYDDLINKAFSVGFSMQKDEQLNSSFPGIAFDYLQWLEGKKEWQQAKQTDEELTKLLGPGWKEQAKNPGAPYALDTERSTILT